MKILVVVNDPDDWPLKIPNVEVMAAKHYVLEGMRHSPDKALVFNMCRTYRYQSLGYYVSLLAAARGHRPMPSVSTLQDMKSPTLVRHVSDDLDELIRKSLRHLQSDHFVLSVYFGRNMARQYDRLSRQLFNMFESPFLRAHFAQTGEPGGERKWLLQRVAPIGANEIPEEHMAFVLSSAYDYFARPRFAVKRKRSTRYDIAILHNPEDPTPPSTEKTLGKFQKAARAVGLEAELIQKEDYGRLSEFDALFIRETTAVNHHTFRFSHRAQAEGLVVIDDPDSVLKCGNKVFLAELLTQHGVDTPRTVIVHQDNIEEAAMAVGFPCVLKKPDSSFSLGVHKADDEREFHRLATMLLEKSDLIIVQEYMPTEFDWRVGVLDRRPIFISRYHMAPRHWQIRKAGPGGDAVYGKTDTIPISSAPPKVVKTALRAANLIGDGLYGVDLKEVDGRCAVVEVNDNPNIDAGYEDAVQKDSLYVEIMRVFLNRIEERKREYSAR